MSITALQFAVPSRRSHLSANDEGFVVGSLPGNNLLVGVFYPTDIPKKHFIQNYSRCAICREPYLLDCSGSEICSRDKCIDIKIARQLEVESKEGLGHLQFLNIEDDERLERRAKTKLRDDQLNQMYAFFDKLPTRDIATMFGITQKEVQALHLAYKKSKVSTRRQGKCNEIVATVDGEHFFCIRRFGHSSSLSCWNPTLNSLLAKKQTTNENAEY